MSKVSKDSVNYRPREGEKHCGNCSMIRTSNTTITAYECTLVAGAISPEAVCDKWESDE